jgi:hypothetical protein
MRLLGADGHVVPDEVVVIELLLKSLSEPSFAGRHTGDA